MNSIKPGEEIQEAQKHRMLPQWQRDNASLCEKAMFKLLSNNGRLSSLAIAAVTPGRKLRASLAIQYMKWANLESDYAHSSVLHECLAKAEFLHSASCILDDIIDGDTVRRGQPVFHVREGLPQAILTAQELIGAACTAESTHPDRIVRRVQDALIASVRAALSGEACDSFGLSDTLKHVSSATDLERVYLTKTTPGFEVSHRIVGIVCNLPEVEIELLATFGGTLGAYYQYANDYHDWFSLDAKIRGGEKEQVLVSLCIPTIVALVNDPAVAKLIGTQMERRTFRQLVEKLRNDGVEHLVKERVRAARERVWGVLPLRPPPRDLVDLITAIDSSEFWGYNYTIDGNPTKQ